MRNTSKSRSEVEVKVKHEVKPIDADMGGNMKVKGKE